MVSAKGANNKPKREHTMLKNFKVEIWDRSNFLVGSEFAVGYSHGDIVRLYEAKYAGFRISVWNA